MNNKLTYRQTIASILMLLWLMGQGSVLAHEMVAEHGLDASCEWHCNSGNNDDGTASQSESNQVTDFSDAQLRTYSDVKLSPVQFRRPYLRGPPN